MSFTPSVSSPPPTHAIDTALGPIDASIRLVHALTPTNALAERKAWVAHLQAGRAYTPRWRYPAAARGPLTPAAAIRHIEALRHAVCDLPSPLRVMYAAKLEELALEAEIILSRGEPARVRSLGARCHGEVRKDDVRVARELLQATPERDAPQEGILEPDEVMHIARRIAKLVIPNGNVRVARNDQLIAYAACGARTLWIGPHRLPTSEAVRVAVHEMLGHLVTQMNASQQPIGLLRFGTAGSLPDREGFAVYLEEATGVLTPRRIRTLAARTCVCEWMMQGASITEAVEALHREYEMSWLQAAQVVERMYRGGGLLKDGAYLGGWRRVREALRAGGASAHESTLALWTARIGLRDLTALRTLAAQGDVVAPTYVPDLASFSRSLSATWGGTSRDTSPPSVAASLTKLELT